jgi:redox-sensing transcriptional repressor
MSPDQIRKDLSYFSKFGRQGRGYNVALLFSELRQILGLDRQWCMSIVGVGRLGRAIMDYKGFVPRGFKIVAAFDKERNVISKRVSGIVIQDMTELETAVRDK